MLRPNQSLKLTKLAVDDFARAHPRPELQLELNIPRAIDYPAATVARRRSSAPVR